jgi:hypothetical protein
MAITHTCECGKTFEAKPEWAGKRAKCPACHQEFRFPASPAIQAHDSAPPTSLRSPSSSPGYAPQFTSVLSQPTPSAQTNSVNASSAPVSTSSATVQSPTSTPVPAKRRPSQIDGIGVSQIGMAVTLMVFLAISGYLKFTDSGLDRETRFNSDNAYGATANALEKIERRTPSANGVEWLIAFLLLWLLIAVNQLRRAVHDNTHRDRL